MAVFKRVPGFVDRMASKDVDQDGGNDVAGHDSKHDINELGEAAIGEEDATVEEENGDFDERPGDGVEDIGWKTDLSYLVRACNWCMKVGESWTYLGAQCLLRFADSELMLSQPGGQIHKITDKDSAEEYQSQADAPVIGA